jgi:hypothetical protein
MLDFLQNDIPSVNKVNEKLLPIVSFFLKFALISPSLTSRINSS